MGIFSWNTITKMFKTEQKPDKKRSLVRISEVEKWLEKQIDLAFEERRESIGDHYDLLRDELKTLHTKNDRLSAARLRNEKISERERQIMQGNRTSFVQKHGQFISAMSPPKELNFNSAADYCARAIVEMENLKKTTARSRLILGEFFSNEVSDINRILSSIEKRIIEIRSIVGASEERLASIDTAKSVIKDFFSQANLTKELSKRLSEEKEKVKQLIEERKTLMAKVAKERSGNEYASIDALRKEKEVILGRMKSLEEDLSPYFSSIDKALRKFSRGIVNGESLVLSYLDGPMKALSEDQDIKIAGILSDLKAAVESSRIELKDKAKEKALAALGQLEKARLQSIRDAHQTLLTRKKEIESTIRASGALRLIEETEYRVGHLAERISKLEADISDISAKLKRSTPEERKKELESVLSELTSMIVRLVE